MPPALAGHIPDVSLEFDPDTAVRLLDDAGAKELADIVFLGASHAVLSHIQDYLLTQWSDHLGVSVEFQEVDNASFNNRIRERRQHIWFYAWAPDYPDPDSFLRMGLLSATDVWDHPPYFELVEAARRTLDHSERLSLYEQAQELLTEEIPIFPLVYSRSHLLVKPWVRKFPFSPMRPTEWKDVVIEPHD